MPVTTSNLVKQYVELLSKIYGDHLKTVILYGSYARGDYTEDSDIDIMLSLQFMRWTVMLIRGRRDSACQRLR